MKHEFPVNMLNSYFDRNQIAIPDRDKYRDSVAAVYVAQCLDIPSSPVQGNLKVYFASHFAPTANEIIGELNEQCVVNVSNVRDMAYKMWATRYRVVHEPFFGVDLALQYCMGADDDAKVLYSRTMDIAKFCQLKKY